MVSTTSDDPELIWTPNVYSITPKLSGEPRTGSEEAADFG